MTHQQCSIHNHSLIKFQHLSVKNLRLFLFIIPAFFVISCNKDTQNPQNPNQNTEIQIPHIFVNVNDSTDIDSKDYKKAEIFIDGKGIFEDLRSGTKIAGRGNYSWSLPKKPYKINLDKAASIFGLSPYKKWILLAEYMDGSMLYNSVPYQTAHLLDMPFTNHIFPVELTVNGQYRGLYVLTESKEVGKDRIDIGKDGTLLELDVYYDDDWKFISDKYKLPVMVQYPESDDMSEQKLATIKNDFQTLEKLIYSSTFPDNNYLDYLDEKAFVDYMIVYQLSANFEINHPKSTYMNKEAGGKYRMGIIWDFDWALGYNDFTEQHYDLSLATQPLLDENRNSAGSKFFSRIMKDPKIKKLFYQRWKWFRENKYQSLKQHVKEYSLLINKAYAEDHKVWGLRGSSGILENDLQKALTWLDARANYIDEYADQLNQ